MIVLRSFIPSLALHTDCVPVCQKKKILLKHEHKRKTTVGKGLRFLTHYLQGTTRLLKLHFIQCTVKSVYILSSLKINK